MNIPVSFRGQSGKAHTFERVQLSHPWARRAGIAIFAAPDTYGWRVVKVAELTGRPHDVRPIWALAEAERFGARAVFVSVEMDRDARHRLIVDIEAGLNPVCESMLEAETVLLAA